MVDENDVYLPDTPRLRSEPYKYEFNLVLEVILIKIYLFFLFSSLYFSYNLAWEKIPEHDAGGEIAVSDEVFLGMIIAIPLIIEIIGGYIIGYVEASNHQLDAHQIKPRILIRILEGVIVWLFFVLWLLRLLLNE